VTPRRTPYAGVIAIWCVSTDKLKPAFGAAWPALTQRMAKIHGVLDANAYRVYINSRAKLRYRLSY